MSDVAPGSRRDAWLLGLTALLLYGIGAWWGVPRATDELTMRGWDVDGIGGIGVLSEMHNLLIAAKPDWYVAYPLLHYFVLAAVYAPYLLWLRLAGEFAPSGAAYPYGFADPVTAFATLGIIARAVTVAMAAGAVVAVYGIGRRIAGRTAGLIAALAVLLSEPMIFYSRTSNLDIPGLFWNVAGVLAAVIALERGLTVRRALVIGSLAAFAVATKDQTYGAWIAGLLYLGGWHAFSQRPLTRSERWIPVMALVGGAALAFAVAGGIVLHPQRFIAHVNFMAAFERNFFNLQYANHLSTTHPRTLAGAAGLLSDAAVATAVAMSVPLFVLGFIGLITRVRISPPLQFLGVMLVGYVVLTILPVRHTQYRYLMFPTIVLAISAGALVFSPRIRPSVRRWLYVPMAVGLAWEGVVALDLTHQMLHDGRYAASDWLGQRAEPNDAVAFYGAAHQLPHLPRGVRPVRLAPLDGGVPVRPVQDARQGEQPQPPDPTRIRWVVVAADYFADSTRVRSLFLPRPIYDGLRAGCLGYVLVATFEKRSLLGRDPPYLPYVNPDVRIFERTVQCRNATGTQLQAESNCPTLQRLAIKADPGLSIPRHDCSTAATPNPGTHHR